MTTSGNRSTAIPSVGETIRSAGVRETVESILVAVMLALLFKAFEAEAFVIPTGSMAPTLQGSHKDVACEQCRYRYRVSASTENPESSRQGRVTETCCPFCRYGQPVDATKDANQGTFSGDRILVSKFSYDIAEPQRFDVAVFRFPENAKQPFIKRLLGLPNEELRIQHGDIFTRPLPDDGAINLSAEGFEIARKEPRKLLAMLQPVDDTNYVAPALREVGWPWRWQQWGTEPTECTWTIDAPDPQQPPVFKASGGSEIAWLRYRHLLPRRRDWLAIGQGNLPPRINSSIGEAIADYYPYDDGVDSSNNTVNYRAMESVIEKEKRGLHWVGDLALEVDFTLESASGSLFFDLVEGGVHFQCEIDVQSGLAVVTADQTVISFDLANGQAGVPGGSLKAQTGISGAGSYHLRFANVDDRIYLWVNERYVPFDLPGTYRRQGPIVPRWTEEDGGDAQPLGVGVREAQVKVDRLRISRDVYYISVATGGAVPMDYWGANSGEVREILDDPREWATPRGQRVLARRDESPATFELGPDRFFMLGDNSPASHDARMWRQKFAERDDLVGKALFVYWPHSWNAPVTYWPNFSRMGFIR